MATSEQSTASGWPKGVGAPAQRALAGAGITRLEDLTRFSEAEVADLHGMGPKALAALRAALAERGLTFCERNPRSTIGVEGLTPA